MTNNETSPLNDHLLALGATPADARALAALAGPQPPDLEPEELVLRVLDHLPATTVFCVVAAWLSDIELALHEDAPVLAALRALVSPSTTPAERDRIVIEAMMAVHPPEGDLPPEHERERATWSVVAILGQLTPDRRPSRVVSEALSNLLGLVMDHDGEAGGRCLQELWAVAAAGVAAKPSEAQ